jgi:hypothetical protein
MSWRATAIVLLLLSVLLAACGGGDSGIVSGPPPSPTPSALDGYRERIRPDVWEYIAKAPWFADERTDVAHMRLIELVATYMAYAEPAVTAETIAAYPDGISDEMLRGVALTKGAWTVRDVLSRQWFLDRITETEYELLSEVSRGKTGINTFSVILERAQAGAWYQDGVDAAEFELLRATLALAQANRPEEPLVMLDAIETGRYITERIVLPRSGDKGIVVVGGSRQAEAQLAEAMSLLRRYLAEVDAVAGGYSPRYIVAQVVDLNRELCGQGVPQAGPNGAFEDLPGVVRLKPSCVRASTTVHELAHVFVGIGPVWFTEGVADLISMRITKQNGGYFGRKVQGLIELELRAGTAAPQYADQGALGAQLLVAVDALIGPEAMNEAIRELSAGTQKRRTGRLVLDTIMAHTPDEKKERLEALFRERIDYTK